MFNHVVEPGTEWTSPDNRGVCGVCGGEEGGYAKRDANGKWQPLCWLCVKPIGARAPQAKRETVGTIYTDVDAEEPEKPKKKNPGLAPSTHRPKVN
jgi:hypothetical protein